MAAKIRGWRPETLYKNACAYGNERIVSVSGRWSTFKKKRKDQGLGQRKRRPVQTSEK